MRQWSHFFFGCLYAGLSLTCGLALSACSLIPQGPLMPTVVKQPLSAAEAATSPTAMALQGLSTLALEKTATWAVVSPTGLSTAMGSVIPAATSASPRAWLPYLGALAHTPQQLKGTEMPWVWLTLPNTEAKPLGLAGLLRLAQSSVLVVPAPHHLTHAQQGKALQQAGASVTTQANLWVLQPPLPPAANALATPTRATTPLYVVHRSGVGDLGWWVLATQPSTLKEKALNTVFDTPLLGGSALSQQRTANLRVLWPAHTAPPLWAGAINVALVTSSLSAKTKALVQQALPKVLYHRAYHQRSAAGAEQLQQQVWGQWPTPQQGGSQSKGPITQFNTKLQQVLSLLEPEPTLPTQVPAAGPMRLQLPYGTRWVNLLLERRLSPSQQQQLQAAKALLPLTGLSWEKDVLGFAKGPAYLYPSTKGLPWLWLPSTPEKQATWAKLVALFAPNVAGQRGALAHQLHQQVLKQLLHQTPTLLEPLPLNAPIPEGWEAWQVSPRVAPKALEGMQVWHHAQGWLLCKPPAPQTGAAAAALHPVHHSIHPWVQHGTWATLTPTQEADRAFNLSIHPAELKAFMEGNPTASNKPLPFSTALSTLSSVELQVVGRPQQRQFQLFITQQGSHHAPPSVATP